MSDDATGENPSYSAYTGRFGELTKRILGGLFVLIAVGALGVIVAGAVAEGDQLFVRFLTAVVVAALGLYVVSDLRLQASKASSQATGIEKRGVFEYEETSDYLADLSQNVADERELESVGASYGSSGSVGYDLAELEELRESLNDLENEGDIFSSPTVSNNDDLVALVADEPNQADTLDQFAWPNLSSESKNSGADDVESLDSTDDLVTPEETATGVVPEPTIDPPVVDVAETEPVAQEALDSEQYPDGAFSEWTPSADLIEEEIAVDVSESTLVSSPQDVDTEDSLVDLSVEPVKATPEVVDLREVIDLREGENLEFDESLEEAIQLGETTVVNTLMDQGMLSTEGEITDRDVRTMVYVAFTSNELRKLIKAGGVPGGENAELELGPVELFDESAHTPAPKILYQAAVSEQPILPEVTTES